MTRPGATYEGPNQSGLQCTRILYNVLSVAHVSSKYAHFQHHIS